MATQGAQQAVGAGATTASITGTFPATYQVGVAPGWQTAWRVTAKTAAGFTVDFASPAPPAGSTFDWTAGTEVSPNSSASVAIAAGLLTASVAGTFGSSYQVAIGPGWLTAIDAITKTAAGFVIQFAAPVPPGGSTFDWLAVVPVNSALAAQATTPIASATAIIGGGLSSLAVTLAGTLPSIYEVRVAPGWVTAYRVTAKTTSGFTIEFASPSPASGSTVDWIINAPQIGVQSLQDYLDELNDLIHDPNNRYWSQTQKIRYINRAMMRRDLDTAINRQTFTFTLTAGTDTYTVDQVNGRIFDVIGIALLYGQTRRQLDQPSLSDMNIYYRPASNFTGWTAAFVRQGSKQIIFGPAPSTTFVTEWDCAVYALPLINLTDLDPVPYPYTQPVPYWAAYQAKINEKQADEREDFLQAYNELIGIATNGKAGRLPSAYGGLR